jgi:hypothetical protein
MKRLRNILTFISFSVLLVFSCQTLTAGTSTSVGTSTLVGKDLYLKLRSDALSTRPEALGINVDSNSHSAYGVLMDDVLDNTESTCTTISFASGDAGLICDSGHGRTDGIKFESVQTAAKKFVSVATSFIGKMELTNNYSLPTSAGNIKFYIVTPQGVYGTKELTEDEAVGGSYNRLWKAQADVITAFRLSDQQPTP